MTGERELVALANENFVASFRKLAEHCGAGDHRTLGRVFAYVTGLPLSLFNGCVVVDRVDPRDLDAALAWVAEHRVPRRLFVASELERELRTVPVAQVSLAALRRIPQWCSIRYRSRPSPLPVSPSCL